MTHAPYAIMGDLVIVYGKATKSACGKRIDTTKLKPRGQQSCEACTKQIALDRAELVEMTKAAKDLGLI